MEEEKEIVEGEAEVTADEAVAETETTDEVVADTAVEDEETA